MDYTFTDTQFHHRTAIQMRFGDFDMFGHVNNTAYLQYCDIAKVHYFETALQRDFRKERVSPVIVNINCDYLTQTRSHEEVDVLTALTKIGTKSINLEQRVVNRQTGEVKCVVRTVMVIIDFTEGRGIDVPTEWRTLFSTHEHRTF